MSERWSIDGTGAGATEEIKEAVNAVHEPFVFQWKHGSWKPWDWTLVKVDNAELNLSDPAQFSN